MARLFKVLGVALSAAFSAFVALIFQTQIARYFSPDRLEAEVYSAKWMPLPGSKAEIEKYLESKGVGPYAIEQIQQGHDLSAVTVDVHNPGAKKVENIRVDVGVSPEIVAIYAPNTPVKIQSTSEIKLDPLLPGDSVRIVAWTIIGEYDDYSVGHWTTYSSEGPILIRYHGLTNAIFNDPTEESVETIFRWMFGIALTIIVLGLLFGVIFYSSYVNQLMKDEDWYLKERERFDADPKKFSPNLKDAKA